MGNDADRFFGQLNWDVVSSGSPGLMCFGTLVKGAGRQAGRDSSAISTLNSRADKGTDIWYPGMDQGWSQAGRPDHPNSLRVFFRGQLEDAAERSGADPTAILRLGFHHRMDQHRDGQVRYGRCRRYQTKSCASSWDWSSCDLRLKQA